MGSFIRTLGPNHLLFRLGCSRKVALLSSAALVFSAGFDDLPQTCLPSSQDFAHHLVAAKRKPDPLKIQSLFEDATYWGLVGNMGYYYMVLYCLGFIYRLYSLLPY